MRYKNVIWDFVLYGIYFLLFMLVEAGANNIMCKLAGVDKVSIYYGIFICFTGFGYMLYAVIKSYMPKFHNLLNLSGFISCVAYIISLFTNHKILGVIMIIIALFILGMMGAAYMDKLAIDLELYMIKHKGVLLGISMALAILSQFVIQVFVHKNIYNIAIIILLYTLNITIYIRHGDKRAFLFDLLKEYIVFGCIGCYYDSNLKSK